ncbi:MAG: hypothetical protein N3B10_11755 [Armatimonadetes bacterium]|nr:hypothetical protein [Armatimonadota bacterium]
MILSGKRRMYGFRPKESEYYGVYFPEQLCIVDETLPMFWGVHYELPSLLIRSEWFGEIGKEKVKEFLLWLDETLPDKSTEWGNFEVIVDDLEMPDIFIAPHPDDYDRLKQGRRKRITELPAWQAYFGETTDDNVQ